MALSGNVSTTGGYGGRRYTIAWTAEQDKNTNRSAVTYTISCTGGAGAYTEKNLTVKFNEDMIFQNPGPTQRYEGRISQGTAIVEHQRDGTATLAITIEVTIEGAAARAERVTELNQIPRWSEIGTVTQTVIVTGTNTCNVGINAKDPTFTHNVKWRIGRKAHMETVEAGSTSASYAVPENWKTEFPDAKTGECTVTLETLDGTRLLGTVSKTFTLSTSYADAPDFTLTTSDANGYAETVGRYLVGWSRIRAEATDIEYKFGTSAKSIKITIGETTTTGTNAEAEMAGVIGFPGTKQIRITITDTRGYSTTRSGSVTAVAYDPPSVQVSISRYRKNGSIYQKDEDGGYGCISYTAQVSAAGSNSLQEVTITYRSKTDEGGMIERTQASGTLYVRCDTEEVYDFEIAVSDKVMTRVFQKQLSTAGTIMDILKGGKGVCIGGVATESDLFEVKWDTKIKGKLLVENPEYGEYRRSYIVEAAVPPGNWEYITSITLPEGYYHLDVTVVFTSGDYGGRWITIAKEEHGAINDLGEGWRDSRLAIPGGDTYIHTSGNLEGGKIHIGVRHTNDTYIDIIKVYTAWHELK